MTEWRIGRGWSDEEIAARLERVHDRPLNFKAEQEEMTPERGWNSYYSEAVIATEPPGAPLPDGPFRRAEVAIANYHFSDPSIVVAHFDAESRLLGRRMLLELKALAFRYLAGAVVAEVRFDEKEGQHTFGYRYDTLEGHLESGSEWFLLTKRLDTGEVVFRIQAAWLPGDFPNWWSRAGFRMLGLRYQKRWHHNAHHRLFTIAHGGMTATPAVDDFGTAHAGPAVVFERTSRHRTPSGPRWRREEEETQSL